MTADLRHQRDQPDDAESDVQAVRADQREERGQERAALRAVAFGDEVRKFVELDAEEAEAEQSGDREPDERRTDALALHFEHREAVGDRRQQQQRRVERDQRQLEQMRAARSTRVAAAEHAVGREQAGEDEAVAHQVQPEAEQRPVFGMMVGLGQEWRGALAARRNDGQGEIRHGRRPGLGCGRLPCARRPPRGCGSRAGS
jgi:hypothetical protein